MFKINKIAVNPFEENSFLLVDEATGDAIAVDPGMFYPEEEKAFDRLVEEQGAHLIQIVNTHLHLDHCFGLNYVKDKYGIGLAANIGDAALGRGVAGQEARFGMHRNPKPVVIDVPLKDGDIIKVGASSLQVIAVPGHTPGGIALYCAEQKFVLSGDSLFRSSIGRTDLGGNHDTLVNSIREKLLTLPADTVVIPGHGPTTTIAAERHNPFL